MELLIVFFTKKVIQEDALNAKKVINILFL
jgi:hypothetical protein